MTQDFRLRLNRASQSYVFREPAALVRQYRLQIQHLETRMAELLHRDAQEKIRRVERGNVRMAHLLQSGVQQAHQRVDELSLVLQHRMERKTERNRQRLARVESQLRMLNPLAVLGRGYSLTYKPDGSVVRGMGELEVGDTVVTQLVDGKVVSSITEKE